MPGFILGKGFAGGQADAVPATFVSATATATIASGQPVQLDGEGKCKPAASAVGFLGIASGTAEKREWVAGESVRIMTIGSLFITTAATATAGAKVGFTTAGAWADSLTATYKHQLDGSQVVEGVTGAGLAKVRLNGVQTTTL